MKEVTISEAKASIGTEYIHKMYDSNGDMFATLPGVVAAFDPKIGLTCLATSLEMSDGEVVPDYALDKNGNLCLIGVSRLDYNTEEDFMAKVTEQLRPIIDNGELEIHPGISNPSCSF